MECGCANSLPKKNNKKHTYKPVLSIDRTFNVLAYLLPSVCKLSAY